MIYTERFSEIVKASRKAWDLELELQLQLRSVKSWAYFENQNDSLLLTICLRPIPEGVHRTEIL